MRLLRGRTNHLFCFRSERPRPSPSCGHAGFGTHCRRAHPPARTKLPSQTIVVSFTLLRRKPGKLSRSLLHPRIQGKPGKQGERNHSKEEQGERNHSKELCCPAAPHVAPVHTLPLFSLLAQESLLQMLGFGALELLSLLLPQRGAIVHSASRVVLHATAARDAAARDAAGAALKGGPATHGCAVTLSSQSAKLMEK
eukprot:4088663-Pleurochrysis_carterae.AAC.8